MAPSTTDDLHQRSATAVTLIAVTLIAVTLIAALLSAGCASHRAEPENLAPLLPAADSRLEVAPPEARDALDEGLRWIRADAPRTKAREPTAADGSAEEEPRR